MDPEERNHYKFIYTRNTSFSFRFIGIFVVLAMFAAIPLIVLTINKPTNENSHADVLAASMTPTVAPSATPSSTSGASYASISLVSPAISTNGGNTQPLHATRLVTINLYNVDTLQKYTTQDTVTFDGVQSFTNAHFNLGSIPSGTYELLVDMPGNLQKLLSQTNHTNTFPVQAGSTLVVPSAKLIPGDIAPIPGLDTQPYGDNILDISDYNILIGCYSDTQTASSCSDVAKTAADENDDGKVNAIDYNILLRSFATRDGDSLPTVLGTTTVTPSIVSSTSTPTPSANSVPTITPTYISTMTTISIVDMQFTPQTRTIPIGTTVTWENNDTLAHTTTADNQAWDSGSLIPGVSFSKTFITAGTYTYHCAIHPTMTGTIVVQ